MSDSRYSAFRATSRFRSFDGLRAFSVIAVIWHHAVNPLGPWGYLGVATFFALSGFLITTLLLRERDTHGEISLRDFYVRRSLRIFPLYYAVLAVYVALALVVERGTAPGTQFLENLPAFLTYTSNWFVALGVGTRTIFYFAWSLATEEQFYLFWPSIVRYGKRWQIPVITMGMLLVADLAVEWAVRIGAVDGSLFPVKVITSLAAPIALGCLVAYAAHDPRSFRVLERLVSGRWATAVLACLIIAMARWGGPDIFTHGLLALLVAACCIRPDHVLAAVLGARPAVYLGSISYGVYLMHMLALNVVRRLPLPGDSPVIEFVAGTVLAVVMAGISFATYERWFLKQKERFQTGRGSRRAQPAPLGPRPPDQGEPATTVGLAPRLAQ